MITAINKKIRLNSKIAEMIKGDGKYPLFIRNAVAFLDQGLLSICNFLIQIILIKTVPKSQYGYYAIAVSVLYLFLSLQNAVVTTPLSVLLVTKKRDERDKYLCALCWGQFIVLLPGALICLSVLGILFFVGLDPLMALLSGALCFAILGMLLREFMRASFFAEEKPHKVLKVDLFYVAIFLNLIVLCFIFYNISVVMIFIFMGLCAVLAFMFNKLKFQAKVNRNIIKQSYVENWKFGRWALLGVITTHIQRSSYLYLLGALISSTAVADVEAAKLILMPFLILQTSWKKVTIPHGAKLRERNQISWYFKELVVASIIFGLLIILYTLIIELSYNQIEKLIFTKKYASAFDYILFWGVIFSITWIRMNASFALQVLKQFKLLAKVNFFTMITTVGSSYFLIKIYGIQGALVAIIFGEFIFASMLWWALSVHIYTGKWEMSTLNLKKIRINNEIQKH